MNADELNWFKSSYSSGGGGECLEVAVEWRKSSYSDGEGGDCVEVATCPTVIRVRDSKVTDGRQLALPTPAWAAFVSFARVLPLD